MRHLIILPLWVAFIISLIYLPLPPMFAAPAFAADSPEVAKAKVECRKAPPVMKHPGDVKAAKREAYNGCMRAKGITMPRSHEK